MAVQRINTRKFISKINPDNPNFIQEESQVEINGNKVSDIYQENKHRLQSENIYGEKKHTYIPEPNGNLQMEQLMGKLMNKLDNIPGVTNGQTGIGAVEVDIKKEIMIGKVDASAVKSEEYIGKVKTKKDKLKALRKRNGR